MHSPEPEELHGEGQRLTIMNYVINQTLALQFSQAAAESAGYWTTNTAL